jgi:L-threonylcarbamoyladenylate synthase
MTEIDRAAGILRAGRLVAFPTETVYGLGADATSPNAVARIYEAKGRPRFNPLIAHVLDLDAALRQAHLHAKAITLAEALWPGPLTIVAPRRADSTVAELACAGLTSIALRAPAHPITRELLGVFGKPIAAPSANRSGKVSSTTAAHVREELGERVDLILDGGASALGLESTIVAIAADGGAVLLRPGAAPRETIQKLIGPVADPHLGSVEAPGMLASHYAPRARLRLNAEAPREGEAYLAFGAEAPVGGLSLSPTGDLVEAAANLYAHLRALDAAGAETIAVAPIPALGLGEAINDRLARAAAPR